jgi:hypothetical protein
MPPMIRPSCGKRTTAPRGSFGSMVECKRCSAPFPVPELPRPAGQAEAAPAKKSRAHTRLEQESQLQGWQGRGEVPHEPEMTRPRRARRNPRHAPHDTPSRGC